MGEKVWQRRDLSQRNKGDFQRCQHRQSWKAIFVVQALEAALEKHIQENIEIYEKNGAIMSSYKPSQWSWESIVLRYK